MCAYSHKLSKMHFTVLTCSPIGLSSLQLSRHFCEMKLSHITGKNKHKVPRNWYYGLFSVNTAEVTKVKTHVFRQREMSSTRVGSERRTSTCLPPFMRSETFGFSLILWRSRSRPRCRCFKSLLENDDGNGNVAKQKV